jgi:hypothetical protein
MNASFLRKSYSSACAIRIWDLPMEDLSAISIGGGKVEWRLVDPKSGAIIIHRSTAGLILRGLCK